MPSPTAAPEPVVVAPESPVRLVGILHTGATLRAALSVRGELLVVGVGDDASGYRVLSIDEEGVRLRGPDGDELALAPPEPPSSAANP
jgi:hypothetical protein